MSPRLVFLAMLTLVISVCCMAVVLAKPFVAHPSPSSTPVLPPAPPVPPKPPPVPGVPLHTDEPTPGSIWQRGTGSFNSCSEPAASRNDPNIAAASSSDPTAISVDMRMTSDRNHCYKYAAPACPFDVNEVQKIEFDIDMKMCGDVWTAPLWMTPPVWGPSQWQSGEIDLVENCRGNVNVSFGNRQGDYSTWPVPDKNDVEGRVQFAFDKTQDVITASICDKDGRNCKLAHTRAGYFRDIVTGSNPTGRGMMLISDIWNGNAGDEGFQGCARGFSNVHSDCNYTVSNVKFTPYDGKPPLFSGSCAALNA